MDSIAHSVTRPTVLISSEAEALGNAGASALAETIAEAVTRNGRARIVVATGNSQFPLWRALAAYPDLPWASVTVFHMDEYLGIAPDHPASFRRWIRERVVETYRPAQVHYIDGNARPEAEVERYGHLLEEAPIDVVCMGIGENGHLAFNEPGEADFDDEALVRLVTLTPASRQQQVGEGHFPTMSEVPTQALTLTIPALLDSAQQIVSVPERRKAVAVQAALEGPVTADCPASILQQRGNATVLLDVESASLLQRER